VTTVQGGLAKAKNVNAPADGDGRRVNVWKPDRGFRRARSAEDIPNLAFEGSTPLQVVERGESDRLWRMIWELRMGNWGD
jgi:hypothetical protein